ALKRSVMDNIWLGRYPKKLGLFTSEAEMYRNTKKIFDALDIKTDPRRIMSSMSVAERQMVEIAKAVSYGAKILVLDEPTSSLSEGEVAHLFRIIDMLKRDGCGIIYISHKMEEILKISDDITVMRDGSHIITEPAECFTMERIIRLMVGRELKRRFPERETPPGEKILTVRGLSSKHNSVKDVSFDVRRGEILGFAGLAGAGRTEVIENLFGLSARESGEIILHGKKIKNRTPREAIKHGFALLTEERRATGIFGILSIRDNTTVSSLKKYRRLRLFLSERSRKKDTEWAIKSMRIKTPSQATQIRSLSGGNQQKVILGRWLLTEPEILMLDEPTRGIDVGAKFEIYQLITDLAKKGKAIIMVSGELPELLGICDRICVMSGGALVGSVDAKSTTQEEILALAAKNV
ncbi:MAG: ATP-binding cassette domain-containing protein, partial [Clostridia bacterium]|nr:ATP-binding cassette domain-containing protein [Clostridia bacterium]